MCGFLTLFNLKIAFDTYHVIPYLSTINEIDDDGVPTLEIKITFIQPSQKQRISEKEYVMLR